MNRQIKFRGKQYPIGEWIYGSLLRVDDNSYIVQNDDVEKDGHHLIFITDVPMFVDKETIGQFTGLCDKNGKEIYEGDVLRFYFNGNEYIVYVGFNSEVGAWCVAFKGSRNVGIRPLGVWLYEYKGIEVIGNIHDNPELIKEEQQ